MIDRTVVLEPIRGADLADVGAFLHDHLNPRLTARQWADAIIPTWPVRSPNHGFLLRDGERIVGVQLAFYSERSVDGQVLDFCNLGAWCVLEEYRGQGLRLLRAVLGQRGYHFTDLSPSGNVIPLNRKLGFEPLDTETALVPHLPVAVSGAARIVTDHDEIERLLTGQDLAFFRDHRSAAAAIHLVLVRGAEHCYVIVRRERRKGAPVFASLLHVGRPSLLRKHVGLLGRHLLLHHGLLATLLEVRLLGQHPRLSYRLTQPRPKMVRAARGTALSPQMVDNLYSELALVAW
jgi:hypothetical protein